MIGEVKSKERKEIDELSRLFDISFPVPFSKSFSSSFRTKRNKLYSEWLDHAVIFKLLLTNKSSGQESEDSFKRMKNVHRGAPDAYGLLLMDVSVRASLPNASDKLAKLLYKGTSLQDGWEVKLLEILQVLSPFEDTEKLFIMCLAEVELKDIPFMSTMPLSYLYKLIPGS